MTSLCTNDESFGPIINGCRENFDFTLFFEQALLSIIPSAIFLFLVPLRLVRLSRSSIKTVPNALAKSTVLVASFLVGLHLALLIIWTQQPANNASIAASTLSFIDSIAILALTWASSRNIRPLSLLTLYLLISSGFNAVELRTLYLSDRSKAILGISTTIIILKVVLLSLEIPGKRRWLLQPYQIYGPESTSSVINRGLFWWLNPLMKAGFRKILSLDDLYATDPALLSRSLERQMERAWNKYSQSTKFRLLKASLYCYRWSLISFIIPRSISIGFSYAQPFLIGRVVDYIGQPVGKTTRNEGYGLIGAAILVYLGASIANVQYQRKLFRTITMFRGGVVSLIYKKSLDIPLGCYDESAALTLMSTDVDRLTFSFEGLAQIWAYVIEIVIGLYLLERQVGWICFAPIVVVLVSLYGATLVSKNVVGAQKAWVEAIQRRVTIISPVLNSMKAIKLMGLSSALVERLQQLRIRELDLSAKFRQLSTWRIVLSQFPQVAGPFVVFVIFAIQSSIRGRAGIDTSQAFTSLAIITLLTGPAGELAQAIPSIGIVQACFDRMEKYLQSASHLDARRERISDDLRQRSDATAASAQSLGFEGFALKLDNVSLKPSMIANAAIQNFFLEASRGSFTMITGPIGSGKTTLLKGILGELVCDTGVIEVKHETISYCAQVPWLQNGTIRAIICGTREMVDIDQQWYETSVKACALDEDISQLSNGHDTEIGTRGVILSGGQKQRLALARAVYARNEIVLLDDVLSALDNNTERIVIDRLLGDGGLWRRMKTTVVMAGHSWRPMHLADSIVVLNADGTMRSQGTLNRLITTGIINHETMNQMKDHNEPALSKSSKPNAVQTRGPSANDIADLTRQTGDISLYGYYITAIGKRLSSVIIVSTAFCAVCVFFPQIWLKFFATGTITSLSLFCSLYALFVVVSMFSLYSSAWLFYCLGIPKSGARFHEILLKATFNAPQSFFDKTDAGVTLNRFSQDMTLVDGALPAAALITLQAGMNVLVLVAFIAAGSSYMGLTIPLVIVALYFLQKLYLRTSRQIRFLDLEAKSPLYSHFVETLEGLHTIRAFGWQSQALRDFEQRLDVSQRPYYLMYCIQRWLNLALGLLIGAMAVVVIALAIAIRSSTNSGSLGVALNGILSLDLNLQYLMVFWTSLETSLSAVARTRTFERETPSELSSEQDLTPLSNWPQQGQISFTNVEAKYESSTNIALSIPKIVIDKSMKVGVIGRTGSGKSTFLSVITGLLPLSNGEITIDGIPVSRISPSTLRERLVTVPQDPFVIPGLTIRENLDLAGNCTDDEIIACLTQVDLSSKLLSHQVNLDSQMPTLSQGESQVFALARVLLRKKSDVGILLLDEATASTDSETDERISRVLNDHFSGWTILMIAHRLDSVRRSCHSFIQLNHGRVVRMGRTEDITRIDNDCHAASEQTV